MHPAPVNVNLRSRLDQTLPFFSLVDGGADAHLFIVGLFPEP